MQMAINLTFQTLETCSYNSRPYFCHEQRLETEEEYFRPDDFSLKNPYDDWDQIMHALAHSSLDDLDGKAMIVVLEAAGRIITDVHMINSE